MFVARLAAHVIETEQAVDVLLRRRCATEGLRGKPLQRRAQFGHCRSGRFVIQWNAERCDARRLGFAGFRYTLHFDPVHPQCEFWPDAVALYRLGPLASAFFIGVPASLFTHKQQSVLTCHVAACQSQRNLDHLGIFYRAGDFMGGHDTPRPRIYAEVQKAAFGRCVLGRPRLHSHDVIAHRPVKRHQQFDVVHIELRRMPCLRAKIAPLVHRRLRHVVLVILQPACTQ